MTTVNTNVLFNLLKNGCIQRCDCFRQFENKSIFSHSKILNNTKTYYFCYNTNTLTRILILKDTQIRVLNN